MIHQTIPLQALNDLLVLLAEQLHLEGCAGGYHSEVNIPTSHLFLYRTQVYFNPFTRERVLVVNICNRSPTANPARLPPLALRHKI